MGKTLLNSFDPPSPPPMKDKEVRRALTDFDFLTRHEMQIIDKARQRVPFKLNRAQRLLFEILTPMVAKETRERRHLSVTIIKNRQLGISTGLMAWLNYICAFLDGFENQSLVHTLPVSDTISKLCTKKFEPIVTAIHPDIFPTITKENLGTSILYHYKDLLGIKRNNYLEYVSAGAKSIRSDTISCWLADEVDFYRNPEELEDIVGGAMPDYGFSLTIYFSTVNPKSSFLRSKMTQALENPEAMKSLFLSWVLAYPEHHRNIKLGDLGELSAYETEVILPALDEYKIPQDEWGDAVAWYRDKKLTVSNMKSEFPTTLSEVMEMGRNKCVFSPENLAFVEKHIEPGEPFTIMTDNLTRKVKAVKADGQSSFKIFRRPVYGHRYRIVVDPIMSQSETSDYFALSVFDITAPPYEQVAVFMDRDLAIEDYADMVVSIGSLYNRGEICPERNIAEALMACIRALSYYNFYYENAKNRAKKEAGVRTTATSKPLMIDKLILLLNQENLILHDAVTLNEMRSFEKQEKRRADGSVLVRQQARKGHHDDQVTTCFIFAGSLDDRQITGKKKTGFSIL